jgi:hypothetical protein
MLTFRAQIKLFQIVRSSVTLHRADWYKVSGIWNEHGADIFWIKEFKHVSKRHSE